MVAAVKEALGWLSDAGRTACLWALGAVVAYGVLFVDMTGNGRLWDALHAVARDAWAAGPVARDVSVRIRAVPARPPDLERKAQDHMLALPQVPEQEIRVPVLTADQPRADAAMADAVRNF